MQFTRTANHKLHALNSLIAIGLFFHLAIHFVFTFTAAVVPRNGCFSSFSSTPPLIAHSQYNLQFQFTKAITIQLFIRKITLFCQFKLFNIGLQLSLIYLLAKQLSFYCRRIQNKAVIHTKHIPIDSTSNIIITSFAHDSTLQHNHTNNAIKNVSTSGVVENTIALSGWFPNIKCILRPIKYIAYKVTQSQCINIL